MLTISVYGPGCANCRKLEEISRKALANAGVQGEVVKVTATPDIVAAGVLKTPGLAINGGVEAAQTLLKTHVLLLVMVATG